MARIYRQIESLKRLKKYMIFSSNRLKRQKKLVEFYSSNSQAFILDAIKDVQENIVNDENKSRDFAINTESIINKRSLPVRKSLITVVASNSSS